MKFLKLALVLVISFGCILHAASERMDPKVWGGVSMVVLDSGLTSPPKLTKSVNPHFPTSVRGIAHYLVVVEFKIDKDGKVRSLHGVGDLDNNFLEAAKEAIYQWEFDPALKDGAKVEAQVRVTIPFKSVTKENRPTGNWHQS